jgi:hypothetical protein
MEDKIALPPTKFQVIFDSTYTDEDTDVTMYKIEAMYTEEKDLYKWEATIINYEIEGSVVQSKNGIDRKKFEFAGSEKTKKK